jgi:hypothetical protein
VERPSFSTLLYRYFFFTWLFRPPVSTTDTTLFERAAVQRHNRRQAAWLPVYIMRWLSCAALFFALGHFAQVMEALPVIARLFYLASVACVSFSGTIAVAWVGMRHITEDRA